MTRRRKCRSSAGRFACRSIQCQAWAISRFARTRKGICLRCGNPIRTQNRIELEARRMSEGDIKTETAPESDVSRLADHLFREESGKLVSVLTGIFGIERLQLAEDVVQEALVRALQTWPYYGIPKRPAGWLTQTAKNLALDVLRREKVFNEKQARIIT